MRNLTVLLIEDDQIETIKFKRIVEALDKKHKVDIARDGEQAIDTIRKATTLPNLILLDLNMPRMNGIEFLKILKNDEKLKYIPVVILTTSNYPNDILKCYEIGIAGYVMKPLKYQEYKELVEHLINYWSNNEFVKK